MWMLDFDRGQFGAGTQDHAQVGPVSLYPKAPASPSWQQWLYIFLVPEIELRTLCLPGRCLCP